MKAKNWLFALSFAGFAAVLACLALARAEVHDKRRCDDSSAPAREAAPVYLGNQETRMLHLATCRFLPSVEKTIRFATRQQAADADYTPCRVCRPLGINHSSSYADA